MKAFEYLKSLIKADTLDSSKSFALVLSCIVGALWVCVFASVLYMMFAVTDTSGQTWIAWYLCCASAVSWLEAESTRHWQTGKEIAQATKSKSRIRSLLLPQYPRLPARSEFVLYHLFWWYIFD